MNPIPLIWRAFGGWRAIKSSVNKRATELGLPTYTEEPKSYRLTKWRPAGFPPRLTCNVIYRPDSPQQINFGRHPL